MAVISGRAIVVGLLGVVLVAGTTVLSLLVTMVVRIRMGTEIFLVRAAISIVLPLVACTGLGHLLGRGSSAAGVLLTLWLAMFVVLPLIILEPYPQRKHEAYIRGLVPLRLGTISIPRRNRELEIDKNTCFPKKEF